MTISLDRQGALGLHLVSIEDMPADKWLRFFRSQEEIDYFSGEGAGFVQRMAHIRPKVLDMLSEASERLSGTSSQEIGASVPERTYVAPVAVQEQPATPIIRPDIINTDMGKFHSLAVLAKNFEKIFPTIPSVDVGIVMHAEMKKLQIPNASGVTYVSQGVLNQVIKAVKSRLDNKLIESLGGEVCHEVAEEPKAVVTKPPAKVTKPRAPVKKPPAKKPRATKSVTVAENKLDTDNVPA